MRLLQIEWQRDGGFRPDLSVISPNWKAVDKATPATISVLPKRSVHATEVAKRLVGVGSPASRWRGDIQFQEAGNFIGRPGLRVSLLPISIWSPVQPDYDIVNMSFGMTDPLWSNNANARLDYLIDKYDIPVVTGPGDAGMRDSDGNYYLSYAKCANVFRVGSSNGSIEWSGSFGSMDCVTREEVWTSYGIPRVVSAMVAVMCEFERRGKKCDRYTLFSITKGTCDLESWMDKVRFGYGYVNPARMLARAQEILNGVTISTPVDVLT